MKLFKLLRIILKNIPRYPTYAEMPTILVFIFFCSAMLVSGYYGLALAKLLALYIETASKVQELGSIGIAIGLFLLGLMLVVYYFGEVTLRCRAILRERWFK